MTTFIRNIDLTDAEKQEVSEMVGKIQLWLLEGRSLDYMSKQLNLPPRMILENMCETIYQFMKYIGPWNYLKWLIRKH